MQTSKAVIPDTCIDSHAHAAAPLSLVVRSPVKRIRLWDLPTRIFHWSLVLSVSTALVSGELGGEWMGLHAKAGLTILGLVVFRLIWGVVGSTHARFAHFAPSLSALKDYLKGRWKGVGHNPLGALSVIALLAVLTVQATTGLFSNDEIDFNGPLFNLVDQAQSNRLTGLHQLIANALFALIAVHIVAIGFYQLVKRNNLIKPMITGWKEVSEGKSASKVSAAAFSLALLISVGVVYGVSDFSLRDLFSSPAHAPVVATKADPVVAVHVASSSKTTPAW